MKKTVKYICILLAVALAVIIPAGILSSKYCLCTTYYVLDSGQMTDSVRVVQLSDIHDAVFGENNKRLIAKVKEVTPDIILITGDLIDSHSEEDLEMVNKRAVFLIQELKKLAPVYISFGNQEIASENKNDTSYKEIYTKAGATVLEREYIDISVKSQDIRLGGIYCYGIQSPISQEPQENDDYRWMQEFQSTDSYKILMFHIPNSWMENSLYEWDVDAVFAGHIHGGQIRMPLLGGVWAPDRGWFPGRECGLYTTKETEWDKYREKIIEYSKQKGYDASYYEEHQDYFSSTLVLSRGLGNTDVVPRFNNIPEIVVVDLK